MCFRPVIRFWSKREFEQFPYWIPGAIWYNSVEPHSEQIRYYACSAHISALNVVLHLIIIPNKEERLQVLCLKAFFFHGIFSQPRAGSLRIFPDGKSSAHSAASRNRRQSTRLSIRGMSRSTGTFMIFEISIRSLDPSA